MDLLGSLADRIPGSRDSGRAADGGLADPFQGRSRKTAAKDQRRVRVVASMILLNLLLLEMIELSDSYYLLVSGTRQPEG